MGDSNHSWVTRTLLGAMLCVSWRAWADDQALFTIKDLNELRSASPVALSPDGKEVLYAVHFFGDKGPLQTEWRLIPLSGGESRRLELTDKFEPKGFLRDGMLFGTYKMDEGAQLALLPLSGSKPLTIFSLPRGLIDAVISPDGEKFALLADARPKTPPDSAHTVVENGEKSVYVLNLATREGSWWCADLKSVAAIAWSRDSQRLAVTTQSPRFGHRDMRATVNVCSAAGNRQLADLAYPTAGLAWSKDESELLFASTMAPTLTPEHVWSVGVEGGAARDRTPDLRVSALNVSGDSHGNVWVAVNRGVTAEVDAFSDGKLVPAFTWPGGSVMDSPTGSPFTDAPPQQVVSVADPKHATNVALLVGGQLKKLTEEGDERLSKLTLGEVRVVHWKSKEGIALEGLLTLPPGYISGHRYPYLVLPHGGPEANDLLMLDTLAQMIAAKGYVVMQPEYRGSTGYGSAFLSAIYQHFGDRAYHDVDSATDFALAQGWADPNRLAIFGWSAGGYMTAWTVTQTHRYRAAIEGAGITDWLSFLPTSDIIQTDYDQRLQEKDPAPLLKYSPVMHTDQVTTPLLILHGAADARVPTFQGQELYTLLKERGKTVRMVTYPGSPHFPVIAEQRADVFQEVGDWLDQYNK